MSETVREVLGFLLPGEFTIRVRVEPFRIPPEGRSRVRVATDREGAGVLVEEAEEEEAEEEEEEEEEAGADIVKK